MAKLLNGLCIFRAHMLDPNLTAMLACVRRNKGVEFR